jgi:hypothetical protein
MKITRRTLLRSSATGILGGSLANIGEARADPTVDYRNLYGGPEPDATRTPGIVFEVPYRKTIHVDVVSDPWNKAWPPQHHVEALSWKYGIGYGFAERVSGLYFTPQFHQKVDGGQTLSVDADMSKCYPEFGYCFATFFWFQDFPGWTSRGDTNTITIEVAQPGLLKAKVWAWGVGGDPSIFHHVTFSW